MSLVTRLAVALVLCATPALADTRTDDPDDVHLTADDWLRIGLERYDREDFAGAIDAFERGHAIEQRPVIVFAIAQAHRRQGDCARARAYYDAFLAGNPGPQQAAAARDQRERCVDAPAPTPAAPVAAPAPASAGPARAAPGRSRWSHPTVLAGGGATVALAGTGVGFLVAASRAADDAAAAPTYDRHRALRERADRRELYGTIALAGAATAAAVTAVQLWRLSGRTEASEASGPRTTWIPTASADAIGVAAVGRF